METLIPYIAIGTIGVAVLVYSAYYLIIVIGIVNGPEHLDEGSYKNLQHQREMYQQDIESARLQDKKENREDDDLFKR